MCGSERLSPHGELRVESRHTGWPMILFKRPGIFSPRPTFEAGLARVCLECGLVMPFLDSARLRRINEEIDTLIPVDDI
jgi:hypothetical protein